MQGAIPDPSPRCRLSPASILQHHHHRRLPISTRTDAAASCTGTKFPFRQQRSRMPHLAIYAAPRKRARHAPIAPRPPGTPVPVFMRAYGKAARTKSAARSPIMMLGAFVFPETRRGMMLASATHSPSTPFNFSVGSTTASASLPIRHVPTG